MQINNFYISKLQIIIFAILLLGLIIAVYLVQTKQIFKSKASQQIYNAFEITQNDENGIEQKVDCTGNECTVNSLEINIKIDPKQLEEKLLENP